MLPTAIEPDLTDALLADLDELFADHRKHAVQVDCDILPGPIKKLPGEVVELTTRTLPSWRRRSKPAGGNLGGAGRHPSGCQQRAERVEYRGGFFYKSPYDPGGWDVFRHGERL